MFAEIDRVKLGLRGVVLKDQSGTEMQPSQIWDWPCESVTEVTEVTEVTNGNFPFSRKVHANQINACAKSKVDTERR